MSNFTLFELFLLQFFLILLNAVFACAEIAVISINDNKLKKMANENNANAKILISLTSQPAKFLATIQVGITLAGFLGSAFAADNFSDRIVNWLIVNGVSISAQKLDVLAVIFITLILSYITLILGELVPKQIAMKYAEKLGLLLAKPLYIVQKVFSPIVWFLTLSTNITLRIFGINPNEKNDEVTEEEIRIMIDVGTENGTIDDTEKKMIHNVFEFDDKLVCDVMTHRTDVDMIDIDSSMTEWEKIMIKTRFSVYPVYKDSNENIIGTLSIKDYLKYKKTGKTNIIEKAMMPVQFIPESLHINDLFNNMQKSRNHFAVVIDEYGGVSGIITMNDLLEEIVGELEDDCLALPSVPYIEQIDENTWNIQGLTPIEEVSNCLNIDLTDEGYDTFAGFILSCMENIPVNKKNLELKYENLSIKVVETTGHKIESAVVKRLDNSN